MLYVLPSLIQYPTLFSPKQTYLVLLIFMVAPHPSLLIILVNYYLRTLHDPVAFIFHLLVTYTLTFLAFSSLIVCIARDPGSVSVDDSDQYSDDQVVSITEALMSTEIDTDGDPTSPARFCRKCWAPKPERAHHCGICGRCVLKMGKLTHQIVMLETQPTRSSLPLACI